MPELPEVETYARYFARHAVGQPIARVEVRDERILGATRRETLARRLRGRAFLSVRRHGKHLFADAGGIWLHLHFGMSGDLAYYHPPVPEPRFARVVFRFTNDACLAFEDMRLFGVVDLVADTDEYIVRHGLGPDPLDPRFTLRAFRSRLTGRRGAIKPLLMGQEVVAGLGNLYVDETLFDIGVDPRRGAERLTADEVRLMHASMRRILRETIRRHAREAELPPRYLIHHREAGARCPRCGGTIRRSVVGGRTTFACGRHQT